jgi:hypothetical protein
LRKKKRERNHLNKYKKVIEMWSDNTVFTDDEVTIENFVAYRSESMYKYIMDNKGDKRFSMWYKTLTHSDLTTRGKRTNSSDGFERNLLYYLSVADMNKLQEQFPEKKFECAKQSNIGMPEEFYKDLGIPRIQRRKGKQQTQHTHIKVNDYMPVYLVNDSLKYFTMEYSEKIMNKLNKEFPKRWKSWSIGLEKDKPFTEIELHEAVHGMGVEADRVFHALRLTMFLNDTIIFVIEHSGCKRKLFIMLEKNPIFNSIMNINDRKWTDDERLRRYQERILIKEGLSIEPPEHLYENDWDDTLLP